MKNKLMILLLIIIGNSFIANANSIDSLLRVLDQSIAQKEHYENKKKREIDILKRELNKKNNDVTTQYRYLNQLFESYQSYICDSALLYVEKKINFSKQQHRPNWIYQSYLQKANILATSGLFSEAKKIMQQIDPKLLDSTNLIQYYSVY